MNLFDYPLVVFVFFLLVLPAAIFVGGTLRRWRRLETEQREDFNLLLSTLLTLLGLVIGFTFSMAVTRYDHRKNLEEEEANAIGTEYSRADLLEAGDSEKLKSLLVEYLDQRIIFYVTHNRGELDRNNEKTAKLMTEMWTAVLGPARANPTPINALVVAGMNDVLNSNGYTQAAWWNRIPEGAWLLLAFISIACNLHVGYGLHGPQNRSLLIGGLPLVIAVAFFLISDIDAPRTGVIRVEPLNLEVLAASLKPPG
jgi:hypothetical protein